LATTKWIIDPANTKFEFRAKHIMITLVSGKYREYEGEVITEDDDFTTANISFRAVVGSIDTHDKKRDAFIKGPDLLDGEKFPYVFFKSNDVRKSGDGFKLAGELTIKDIIVKTDFDLDYLGIRKNPNGITTANFVVKGIINRKLWGLIWNEAIETGGVLAIEVIQVICVVQLIKQE
jgi:polyisoprenoid-binding protein YceI